MKNNSNNLLKAGALVLAVAAMGSSLMFPTSQDTNAISGNDMNTDVASVIITPEVLESTESSLSNPEVKELKSAINAIEDKGYFGDIDVNVIEKDVGFEGSAFESRYCFKGIQETNIGGFKGEGLTEIEGCIVTGSVFSGDKMEITDTSSKFFEQSEKYDLLSQVDHFDTSPEQQEIQSKLMGTSNLKQELTEIQQSTPINKKNFSLGS